MTRYALRSKSGAIPTRPASLSSAVGVRPPALMGVSGLLRIEPHPVRTKTRRTSAIEMRTDMAGSFVMAREEQILNGSATLRTSPKSAHDWSAQDLRPCALEVDDSLRVAGEKQVAVQAEEVVVGGAELAEVGHPRRDFGLADALPARDERRHQPGEPLADRVLSVLAGHH